MCNGLSCLECYKKLLENVYFGTVEPNLKCVRSSLRLVGSALVSVQVKTTEKWKNRQYWNSKKSQRLELHTFQEP